MEIKLPKSFLNLGQLDRTRLLAHATLSSLVCKLCMQLMGVSSLWVTALPAVYPKLMSVVIAKLIWILREIKK